MIEKIIHSQDSYYKLQYRKSGETSLNLSNDIKDLLAPTVARGESCPISFTIFREDFVKASCYIIGLLPLYKSSSKDCKKIEYDESLLTDRIKSIQSLFGEKTTTEYKVNLLYREDGRIYLNDLKYNGFNIREYLIEEHSVLTFDNTDDKLTIRLFTGTLEDNDSNNITPPSTPSGLNASQLSYLTAIRTKPFLLLAGISGTGKSRIVRKLAQATDTIDTFSTDADRWKCHSPQNFCLIQVKPNWHNSMDVVGFKSNIGKEGEHYEYTTFVEFIAKAWKHEDVPFFLCLDEMNLAPVEEYFAEFLSAIESRSNHDGSYETDPIIKPFREFGEKVAIEMIDHLLGEKMANLDDDSQLSHVGWRFLNQGLTLPKNLIVMGTVNMDETTFSFSRKVLDRAMSIEMNEVSYDDFLTGKTEEDIPVLVTLNEKLVERPISAQKVKDEDSTTVIEYLKAVNSILDGTPFKLGYRAANEAILYIAAAKSFGSNDIGAALDDFTLMKILSRIEGDDSKLKTKDGKELLNTMFDFLNIHFGEEAATKSQVKLKQMIDILERDHFVSFWG